MHTITDVKERYKFFDFFNSSYKESFLVHWQCPCCKQKYSMNEKPMGLTEIIKTTLKLKLNEQICPDCKNKTTKYYLVIFFDNKSKFNPSFTDVLRAVKLCDLNQVKSYVSQMKYLDYLKTPYWKAIATEKKKQITTCQLCGSDKELEVHHPENYQELLGLEMYHMERLTCLCKFHHNKYHEDNKAA